MSIKNRKLRRELVEIERERVEIERERRGCDKTRTTSEKNFGTMGAGTRIIVLISGAAVLVSAIVGITSVWVSKITKEKEIQLSAIQKNLELEKAEAQKRREWDLSLTRFIVSNQDVIFNGTPQEQEVVAKIIPALFPADISITLLERLEKASSPPTTMIWGEARARLETSNTEEAASLEGKPLTVGIPYSPDSGNSSPNLLSDRRLSISLLLTALVGAGLTVPWIYERFKERLERKKERKRKGLNLQLDSPHT
jgi:hypothetical protein